MIVNCQICNKDFNTKPALVKRGRKYCTKECANRGLLKGTEVECHVCHKKIWRTPYDLAKAKTKTFFCGPDCRSKWVEKDMVMKSGENHWKWKDGRASYRHRALKEHGAICSNVECPIKSAGIQIAIKMLDVDHIDSNRRNNELSNLKVLCVWCHAVKTRCNWK